MTKALTFTNITNDSLSLYQDPTNAGAVFQEGPEDCNLCGVLNVFLIGVLAFQLLGDGGWLPTRGSSISLQVPLQNHC